MMDALAGSCRTTVVVAMCLAVGNGCGGTALVEPAPDDGSGGAGAAGTSAGGSGGSGGIGGSGGVVPEGGAHPAGPSGVLTDVVSSMEIFYWAPPQQVERSYSWTSYYEVAGYWSEASVDQKRGYFYNYSMASAIALAAGVSDVSQIHDAASLPYHTGSVGPIDIGEIAVLRDTPDSVYMAVRFDDIYQGPPPEDAPAGLPNPCILATIRWWVQPDGSGDFSGF